MTFPRAEQHPIAPPMVEISGLNLYYGEKQALKNITVSIARNRVTAFIGPSGCGKSTLLRCLNRMNDLIDGVRISGELTVAGSMVYSPETNVTELRKRIGMVFQKSNPFPKSIYENVAFGPRLHRTAQGRQLDAVVEEALKAVALWDEVRNRLKESALDLSGGQQQRLCIARAIAVQPDILLMDEPCSALDPIATAKIEDLIYGLRERYTIIIVTHNMQQAARISDQTCFLLNGELIEADDTAEIFQNPKDQRTLDYITGRFG